MCRKTLRARRPRGLRCGASGLRVKSKNTGRGTSGGHCVSSFTLLVFEHAGLMTKTKSEIHRKGRNGRKGKQQGEGSHLQRFCFSFASVASFAVYLCPP